MYSLGIIRIQDHFRFALIHDQDKKLIIERLEESAFIPAEILSIKNLSIVTGVEGEAVLRRDVTLPLSSERLVRMSLPFQLEPLLPFSLDQSIIFPQFHSQEKETVVTIWATEKEFLQSHLIKWQSLGIDPDRVSYETLALARWARFFFPHKTQFTLVFENIAIAVDHERIVCAMHSLDRGRLKLFLKQKYPLFESIDGTALNESWPSEKLWLFAIPIGLALESFEKKSCQLRSNIFKSTSQKRREGRLLKAVLALGLGMLVLTSGLSKSIFYFQERALKKQIAPYQITSDDTLEKNIDQMRQKILRETKSTPPIPTIPVVQDILAWLSTLKTVDIQHVEYQLTSYPQEKNAPYQGQVILEFQAESSNEADQFIKQLQQSPSFVESTHELKWTSHPAGYQLSFPLQKSS